MLDDNDVYAQLLALSWLVRGYQVYPGLADKVDRAVSSPDQRVREGAVKALSRPRAFTPSRAASAISRALTDSDVEVRVSALLSLGNFGSDASVAVPQLRQLLGITDVYSEQLGAHLSPRNLAC